MQITGFDDAICTFHGPRSGVHIVRFDASSTPKYLYRMISPLHFFGFESIVRIKMEITPDLKSLIISIGTGPEINH